MLDGRSTVIKVGDTVYIPVRVSQQFGGADFTEIEVQTVRTHPPHHRTDTFTLNSAQVEKTPEIQEKLL